MIANLLTWLPDQIIHIVGGTSVVLAILLDFEPGLWLSGSHYRYPDLGLPERHYLSLRRLLERRLLEA